MSTVIIAIRPIKLQSNQSLLVGDITNKKRQLIVLNDTSSPPLVLPAAFPSPPRSLPFPTPVVPLAP